MDLYIFQWPSDLGGADTRLVDLLVLLSKKYNIVVVPNYDDQLLQLKWVDFLNGINVKFVSWNDLPGKCDSVALSFCNFQLFKEWWRIKRIKDIGFRFVWSNDMMYHIDDEIRAVGEGLVDSVIYTSEFHKSVLSPDFKKANKSVKEFIIPNYIDKSNWVSDVPRKFDKDDFRIGKLSRATFGKFSDGFPMFYESLSDNCKFRIMGWGDDLIKKYSWHCFDSRWEFFKESALSSREFLDGVDVYVYDCHHFFIENQSRSILEASLLGIPVIAPRKWNFPNLVVHGKTGFLWDTFEECVKFFRLLVNDVDLYRELSFNSVCGPVVFFCDEGLHLRYWGELLGG